MLAGMRRRVLLRLMAAEGRIVTDDAMLAHLYDDADGGPLRALNCVQVAVCQLRKSLPPGAIIRERGIGYRLDPAVAATLPGVDG